MPKIALLMAVLLFPGSPIVLFPSIFYPDGTTVFCFILIFNLKVLFVDEWAQI